MTLDFETVVVGAGISGIGTAIEFLRKGMSGFVVLERADNLGGTWRDNDYPGVAVDIPSISYSFHFELDYPWSRTYAPGAEILAYLQHCSRKYGVDKHIEYGVDVARIEFDAASNTWTTVTQAGKSYRSRYVIAATGLFGAPKQPDIPGLDTFSGKVMHTALWDHDYTLAGKRVGLIGTGASAVQVVPSIAPVVDALKVFQRTPIWVGPKRDFPITDKIRSGFFFSALCR
jgi:cation diffusion facilitator CzcD-associated flavoprotein CzcO